MGVFGEVRIVPLCADMTDVAMRVDSNGFNRPLNECGCKEVGRYGEELAALLLASKGLEILDRNWLCPFGEADIVAQDDGCIVLVEVKTRMVFGEDASVAPEMAVDYRKRSRYQKLALVYLANHAAVRSVRFDVVAVNLTGDCDARVRHLVGAYEWDD